ncbi:MAG: peptidylprolyl isomerase [Bacteroidetes bacterium]|jgi:peptidyl-prolyl cis-trans isomerase C|nr:peptidylprolyl isomerase [Bacteroidota bacterium]
MTSSTPSRRSSISLLAAVLLTVAFIAGCGGGNANTAEDDGPYTIGEPISDSSIAAIVSSSYGTDTLTADLYQATFNQVAQQNPALRTDNQQQQRLRRDIVVDFVMRHLVMGEAEQREIAANPAMVAQQLQQIQSRFPNQAAFDSALTAQGFTIDSLRSTIQQQLKMRTLQQEIAQSAPSPSAAAVDSFRQARAQEVRAQHILFLTRNADEQAKDSIQQFAASVLDSVQSGTNFAELAERHSEDPRSAAQGGDLGYFSRGRMVPAFEDAAFSLADSGAVYPELVESQFGYHIIRLTGKRTADLMDSTRAVNMLAQEGQQGVLDATLDSLRTLATVRLNPEIADVDLNADPEADPAGS